MPVIFTTPREHEEHDDRMRALWDEANALHRSLPDGAFRVVATAITLGDRAALMFRNAGRNQQFIVARCRSPNRSVRRSRVSTPIGCNKLLARSALFVHEARSCVDGAGL